MVIRDRAKLLQESILKLDKYRNIVTKRRLRNEVQSSEKTGCSNLLKTGSQIHQGNSDVGNARPEERTKITIPNRRVRSSMAEAQVCIYILVCIFSTLYFPLILVVFVKTKVQIVRFIFMLLIV